MHLAADVVSLQHAAYHVLQRSLTVQMPEPAFDVHLPQ
jgi:hypothetical protein